MKLPDHPSAAELDAMREEVLDVVQDLCPGDTTSVRARRLMNVAVFLGREAFLQSVIEQAIGRPARVAMVAQA